MNAAARAAARYAQAKALGLCLQCWKRERETPAFCGPCAKKKRRWRRKQCERKRREAGTPMRLCKVCGEPGHDIRYCPDKPYARCRCGLSMPAGQTSCGTCPSIVDFATARRAD